MLQFVCVSSFALLSGGVVDLPVLRSQFRAEGVLKGDQTFNTQSRDWSRERFVALGADL